LFLHYHTYSGIDGAVIAMSMVGKLFIEANFGMIYIVTAELYPTTVSVNIN